MTRLSHLFLVFIGLSITLKLSSQNTESLKIISGEYVSYKWIGLPVAEMLDNEANSYLKKKMIINKSSLILFSDTVSIVEKYEFKKKKQNDFFRVFRDFDYKEMNIKGDSITVMSAIGPKGTSNYRTDIIITEKFLVTEYKGIFYFFKKKK